MGVPEPSKEPEWASVPGVDPVSGQPNIVEPSESKKDSGFNFKERPPRQDFNWWMNLVWDWVKHFKSRIAGLYTNLSAVVVAGGLTPDLEDTNQLYPALLRVFNGNYIEGFRLMSVAVNSPADGKSIIVVSDGIASNMDMNFRFDSQQQAETPWPSTGYRKIWDVTSGYTYGENQPGIAPGSNLSALWWYVFVFYNSDTPTLDIAFDSDPEGSNVAAMSDVLAYRRIFCCLNGLEPGETFSCLRRVTQYGDYFMFSQPEEFEVVSGLNSGVFSLPINNSRAPDKVTTIGIIKAGAYFKNIGGTRRYFRWYNFFGDARAPSSSLYDLNKINTPDEFVDLGQRLIQHRAQSPTNNNSVFAVDTLAVGETIDIRWSPQGWIDLRNRDWISGQGVTNNYPGIYL